MVDRIIEKKRWTPKRIAAIAGAGIIIVIIIYALLLSKQGARLNVRSERIRIDTVVSGEFQEFIPVTGTVIPINTYYLDAVEGGRVDTVYLEAGTFVDKGERILKLANTNLLMDVMYREAEIFQQSNNLRNTRLSMERNSLEMQREILDLEFEIRRQSRVVESNIPLAEKNLISQREFDESKDELEYLKRKLTLTRRTQRQDSIFRTAQIEQLEASLVRMEQNLAIVKQNMENLVIKAPVSGHLTSLNAEVGESKQRGERLGQIDILDGFKVRVPVDEHYIARINTDQEATFTFTDETFRVAITKIYPAVVEGRFTVDMNFVGEEPAGIRRGQSLRLRLELGDLSKAVLLPTGGFYQTTGGRWIYVMDESGAEARKRRIQLGRQNTEYYEVLDGLVPGERVIVSPYDTFGDVERLVLK
jgi:HlyD family secretion protein